MMNFELLGRFNELATLVMKDFNMLQISVSLDSMEKNPHLF